VRTGRLVGTLDKEIQGIGLSNKDAVGAYCIRPDQETMKIDRDIQGRRAVRLKGYDYSEAGAYFVTMCAYDRECLYGDVTEGNMQLNKYGMIAEKEWVQTSVVRPNVQLDEFIVMPNHIHGILIIEASLGDVDELVNLLILPSSLK